jgi:hypothetical protein
MDLLGEGELEQSAIVANCRMNRERGLVGSNGYDRELGFNPLDFLKGCVAPGRPAAWLDPCCGTGKALIEAARIVHDDGLESSMGSSGSIWSAAPITPTPARHACDWSRRP